ncbi:MAG: HAMP domain-containing sensor histidine kinase [Crocinitomicaceae bacterium]|nr:HAMP domain-containing sensor histidine kinase [Crocinitomicaceae bacterium]
MSSKKIRVILALMVLTISALFITQAYWFKKSFDLEERQLDEKLNVALRNVADKLMKLSDDYSSRIPPISKLSSNEFYIETECYFSLEALDTSIRIEFAARSINVDFDYVIVEAETNEIVLGNNLSELIDDAACLSREEFEKKLNFKIRLNNKTTYLLNSMGIWIFSSFTLLVILSIFIFIMISLLRSRKLSRLKRDFVNNMTHELKTPIANISVASEALRDERMQMDANKRMKYADIIYNENVRLHNLVDRVLQISAMEKKEESISKEPCNVHELIAEISLNFEPLIQQKNGDLQLSLEAEHFILQADKLHLSNVIYNLIENAIKYSKESPEINVQTNNNNEGILIHITDKGVGISKENQQRIFEKFFRAETGDIHNTKGYGLGLSYVKLIIEKHGGTITFKSIENKGSTFTLFLPR